VGWESNADWSPATRRATGPRRSAAARRPTSPPPPATVAEAEAFSRTLAAWFPFVISVSIAGSLASGGFRESDDVDLNLVVEDGHRHLAYVVLNLLGIAHALRHRGKPVDAHTARPLAPRVMTANLVLERSQCFPLARQDEDMAYELLASRTVVGGAFLATVVAANRGHRGALPPAPGEPRSERRRSAALVAGGPLPSLSRPSRESPWPRRLEVHAVDAPKPAGGDRAGGLRPLHDAALRSVRRLK